MFPAQALHGAQGALPWPWPLQGNAMHAYPSGEYFSDERISFIHKPVNAVITRTVQQIIQCRQAMDDVTKGAELDHKTLQCNISEQAVMTVSGRMLAMQGWPGVVHSR